MVKLLAPVAKITASTTVDSSQLNGALTALNDKSNNFVDVNSDGLMDLVWTDGGDEVQLIKQVISLLYLTL